MKEKEPWIFSRYENTGQAKFIERYFHDKLVFQPQQGLLLIPDASFLRIYLSLFEDFFESNHISDICGPITLVLLESVAEWMDYRHTSPSISVCDSIQAESTVGNERKRILSLYQKYHKDTAGCQKILVFPDLSFKDKGGEDEFDVYSFQNLSMHDRSRFAISRAANILLTNISEKENIQILVLTEDELLLKTQDEYHGSVKYMSRNHFLSYLSLKMTENQIAHDNLTENHWGRVMERCEKEYIEKNHYRISKTSKGISDNGFFEYYSPSELSHGLLHRKFFRGIINVTNENPKEAYCVVDDYSGKVNYYLNGNKGHFNRSIDGDTVIIEPLPFEQWDEPMGKRRLVDIGIDDNDSVAIPVDGSAKTVPTARVVGLHSTTANRRKYVATMIPSSGLVAREESNIVLIPMDSKIPKIRIKSRIRNDIISSKRLLVEIDEWQIDSSLPVGHIVKILGEVGDLETEIKCLLLEHRIDLTPFSAVSLASLPSSPEEGRYKIEVERSVRRDLCKSRRIFSVDPQGCQDIDDAMHVEVLDNGDIEVGVHIADVTHFVRENSTLDYEASRRSTTFYLVDRRFDMLPSILSSDLCSLHGKIDRLAVSIIWTFSSNLEKVKSTWYGRTIIHNVAAMTYEQAHNILQDKHPEDANQLPPPPLTAGAPVDKFLLSQLKNDLSILTKLSQKLKARREVEGGAVDLSSGERGSELKFELDENGNPVKIAGKREMEIHQTIAELMIMANGFVAQTIYSNYPDNSLLRIHGEARDENFNELEHLLRMSGQSFDGSSNMALAKTLRDAKLGQNGLNEALFQSLATRAMMEAQYVCSSAGLNLSHYGLGIEYYTHFTSPIRRYADIVVHRLLLACPSTSTENSDLPKPKQLEVLCNHLNSQSRLAKQISHNCQRLFLSLYFQNHTENAVAVITDLKQNGFVVYVPKYDIKGPVFLTDTQGNVQMKPSLFGAPLDIGMSPTSESIGSHGYRVIPDGKIILHDNDSNGKTRLDVLIPGGFRMISFSVLDIVTVQISCDLTTIIQRIPPPRLHLVACSAEDAKISQMKSSMNISDISQGVIEDKQTSEYDALEATSKSIYSTLATFKIDPKLQGVSSRLKSSMLKPKCNKRIQSIKGRLYFNGFRNEVFDEHGEDNVLLDDIRGLSIEEKAKRGDYDATRQIERETTLRMQKLSAEHRNARRSKASKRL